MHAKEVIVPADVMPKRQAPFAAHNCVKQCRGEAAFCGNGNRIGNKPKMFLFPGKFPRCSSHDQAHTAKKGTGSHEIVWRSGIFYWISVQAKINAPTGPACCANLTCIVFCGCFSQSRSYRQLRNNVIKDAVCSPLHAEAMDKLAELG